MSPEEIHAALREVDDPEFPISIVDMGLVRGVELVAGRAVVKLTYTSMGCPCQDLIKADVRERLLQLDGVDEVEIEECFEEWRREHMSRRGVRRLRELGVGMKAERDHEYYQVFARRKADEPLQHIGTVGASEPDDAEVFAFKLYDQWRWTEMFVAPSRSILSLRRPE